MYKVWSITVTRRSVHTLLCWETDDSLFSPFRIIAICTKFDLLHVKVLYGYGNTSLLTMYKREKKPSYYGYVR
jgi:hypothetical protein